MEIKVKHDTIHLNGKCKADTIYRIRSVPFERIKLVKPDRADAIIEHTPGLWRGWQH